MLDLHEGILSEFAERSARVEPKLLHGYHVVSVAEGRTLPTGAEYRALKLCPDCGQTPQAGRMRCEGCAKKHAFKCKQYFKLFGDIMLF